MNMTPEKLAFIGGQSETATLPPEMPTAKTEERSIEVAISKEADSSRESPARASRRSGRRIHQETPGASEVLDQVLVPVTIRLPHRMAQSLRRAYLEQRLKHAKPDTQQEIVEEALGDWLSRQGFLL